MLLLTPTLINRLVTTQLFSQTVPEIIPVTEVVKPPRLNYCVGLEDSDYTQVLYCDNLDSATAARKELESILGNPREPSEKRFVWDPWFVNCGEGTNGEEAPLPGDFDDWDPIPGEREASANQVQYSMCRSQCNLIFSEGMFDHLVEEITALGRSIGCSAISPPWISLYGDSQMQNYHIDPKQGNMAWTLSLSTGYGSTFSGGETTLLAPNVLDFWRDFDGERTAEAPSLVRFLPPTFGRFMAFDGRVPHMVQKVVTNGFGPLNSRIMIHGWFAEPETIWYGDELENSKEAENILNEKLENILQVLGSSEVGRVLGFLSVRLSISPGGSVISVDAVCDTLREDPADFSGAVGYDHEGREILQDSTADVRLTIGEAFGSLIFPTTNMGGEVVVPFDFV